MRTRENIRKGRITFLACTNASGRHKLKPLLIGTARNPRCFKKISLPVVYKNSKNAWMTSTIFSDWFHHSFVPEVRRFLRQQNLPEKAILLLDNAPSHPPKKDLTTEDGKIITIFLPPNVTPLIQPMDQNVIRLTKLYYRTSLLSSIISNENQNDIKMALKSLNIKDAVLNLVAAWDKVGESTIKRCWRNILENEPSDDEEENIPLSVLRAQYRPPEIEATIQDTLNMLRSVAPEINYTSCDVLTWNQDNLLLESDPESVLSDEDFSTENTASTSSEISSGAAIEAFTTCIAWAQRNTNDVKDILVLKKLKEAAIRKNIESKTVQQKLTHYFKQI